MKRRERRWLLIASYGSVAVALLLIIGKLSAWAYTGSTSILASLTDSLMDSLASLVNLFAVRYSLQPPDRDHRFGHGKAESVAAVAQAAFVLGSGVLLLLHCVERLWQQTPHQVQHTGAGIAVISVAMALTLVLLLVQGYAIRLTNSEALRADRVHYRSDLLLNVVVLMALAGATRGWASLDLYLGMAIALFIAGSALVLGRNAMSGLMDQELPDTIDDEIRALALTPAGVTGVHDLRSRRSGRDYMIQLHIEIDDNRSLLEAHEITETIESRIRELYPNADVIIHQDPASIGSSEHRHLAEQVEDSGPVDTGDGGNDIDR